MELLPSMGTEADRDVTEKTRNDRTAEHKTLNYPNHMIVM